MGSSANAEEIFFREEILPSKSLVQGVSLGMGVLFVAAFALVPISPWLTGCMVLMAVLFTWWMRVTKLVTEVHAAGMTIRMSPFPARKISAEQIEGWRVHMTYPWGLGKRGWAVKKADGVTVYMAGNKPGLVIGLSGQTGIWLGSDQPEQIARALTKAVPKRRKSNPKKASAQVS